MNVYGKLAKCRVQLQEAKLKKSGKNKYAGFEYFGLADFLPAANKIFAENGLCPIFNIFGEKAILNIFNVDDPNDVIVFQSQIAKLELKGCNEIQALGGTITYMRRYLYINALEIVENDSFDAVVAKPTENKAKQKAKTAEKTAPENTKTAEFITAEQKKTLREKIGGNEFAKLMNKSGGKITIEEFERISKNG